ncbi:toxin-antitoxin system YwqK family antitoxin [Sunxiuqinia sp. A32]|uniref:toxin-antitoxin system YwqK family antitoxin n=1 Tax=Sunxiuqinia sp. A32 TaxID=3461496 RepID=UPI00404543D9
MKQFTIFIIFIFFSIVVFSQDDNYNKRDDQGRKQGIWKKYQDNGKLLYEGTFMNDKPVGEFKRYHPNGMLMAYLKHDVYSDTTNAELFDTRARLIARGMYIGQKKTGIWSYFTDGKLISEEVYKNGLKDGKSKTYYPTGELFEETEWENNKQSGVYRAYFKNGKPYMECQMKLGQRNGTCQVNHENGQLELDAYYKNGLRQNKWNYYDTSGNLSYTLEYDLGVLMNPEVLDSIQQIEFEKLESGRHSIVDPEKFLQDPVEYMIKNKMRGQ